LKAIEEVTEGITAKSAHRDFYFSKRWISAAHKTEVAIDGLRQKLDHLRMKPLDTKPSIATKNFVSLSILI